MKKILLSVLLAMFLMTSLAVAEPILLWAKTFGTSLEDKGYAVVETSDGGLVLVGSSNRSLGGELTDSGEYVWLIKTDNNGSMEWDKKFYGLIKTWGMGLSLTVINTSDSGYAIATARGNGFWLIKTNSGGDTEWEKEYGTYYHDIPFSLIQTSDGGYAMLGRTPVNWDFYLVKTDSNGNEEWNKSYGDEEGYVDQGYSVVQDSDGGYSLVGRTRSHGLAHTDDVWIIKIDSNGNHLWNKTFGTSENDEIGWSHVQDSDGNYVISAIPSIPFPTTWLIKIDSNGNHLWNKTIEGALGHGIGKAIIQTSDGGYAVTGMIQFDMAIIKTDVDGNVEWNLTVGGENGRSIIQTSDGSYVVIGATVSDVEQPCLACDFYVAKAGPPTVFLSTISVGNSTIYMDNSPLMGNLDVWQDQQLISTDAGGTTDLTLICCEDNTNTCTPSLGIVMVDYVCTDYKPAPYSFECSYQPIRTYGDPEPLLEETRYLRCAVNDSIGSSAIVSTSYTTSLDCQNGSEYPVLPALAGGCRMRHDIILQATPPVPIDPSVTFDTNDVILDCNDHLYDIDDEGIDPAFRIVANGTTIKDCDIYGPKELMGFPFPPGTSLDYEFVTSASILSNNFYTSATDPNPRFRAINFDWSGQAVDGITIEGNSFYGRDGTSGVYYAIKERNNDVGTSTFNNFNIKNNYFESGVLHLRLKPFRDASIIGTINIEDNTWYSAGNDIPPSGDAYFTTLFGGNIDWIVRDNNVSEWYNSTKYWDEPYCSNKEDVNCFEWLEGPVLVQRSGSILFENNDIRNVAGVHTFREMNNNSVIIYNNLFQDTGQLEIRTVGANVTKNSFIETPNIVNVMPVRQLVNVVRFTSAEPILGNYYAHDSLFKDNTITGARLVRAQGRGFPINNLIVSDNALNYIRHGTTQVNETNQIQCYFYNDDYRMLGNTGSGMIHLAGGVYDALIENNTINDMLDSKNTVVVTQWGSHADCPWTTGRYNFMSTGTGNKIRNNIFNENVNQYNTWIAPSAEEPVNTYDNSAEPNYWAKNPRVVSVSCADATYPNSVSCEAAVEDVRWYDTITPIGSINKDGIRIDSDDEAFTTNTLTTRNFVFTVVPTEDGLWTANATIIDALGGIAEASTTFYYHMDSDNDGVLDTDDLCLNTLIPEATVPSEKLGVNRFALTNGDTIFDTVLPKGKGPQKSFTTADTFGCSCEQILALNPDVEKGHEKFGCSISKIEEFITKNGGKRK